MNFEIDHPNLFVLQLQAQRDFAMSASKDQSKMNSNSKLQLQIFEVGWKILNLCVVLKYLL